ARTASECIRSGVESSTLCRRHAGSSTNTADVSARRVGSKLPPSAYYLPPAAYCLSSPFRRRAALERPFPSPESPKRPPQLSATDQLSKQRFAAPSASLLWDRRRPSSAYRRTPRSAH